MNCPPFLILRPKPGTDAANQIAENSGIVGLPRLEASSPSYLVYFEGNLYGASNLQEMEQRIKCAADRMACAYPTVARGLYPQDQFEVIGQISYSFNEPNNHWWVQFNSGSPPCVKQ
jgi:hypothetical protein